jgi:hypothetical protein
MKQVSRTYHSLIIGMFLYTHLGAAFLIYLATLSIPSPTDWPVVVSCSIVALVFLAAFWLSWWSMRFSKGRYELDAQGITTQNRKKTTHLRWDECRQVGLALVQISPVNQLVYAFATTNPLTAEERTKFLAARKNDWEHTAFFECDEASVKELLSVLPERLSASIRADAVRMEWWECLRG